MSSSIWTPPALSSEQRPWQGTVWRMVESQHIASTMKLVDNHDEQYILESLLENAKPKPPGGASGLHFLLATPFRYAPQRLGSRFRALHDPGVFYGAVQERTAAAELGYWRWKFLRDAVELDRIGPVAHTAFTANIDTTAIDLTASPFVEQAATWMDPESYAGTQGLARVARQAQVGAICYASVRDPEHGLCVALLTPQGFAEPTPVNLTSWFLAVSREGVIWKSDRQVSLAFQYAGAKLVQTPVPGPG